MHLSAAVPCAFVVAYAVGSIPFGLITARLVAGIDIRKAGSGNIGATNVGRLLGVRYFVLVLVLDCLKGALPTLLLPCFLLPPHSGAALHLAVMSGVAAILGHMFPCWLGFRGGKGVATALGVVLILAPQASAVATIVFAIGFAIARIVSLSSIGAACAFCVFEIAWLLPKPFGPETWSLAAFSIAVPLLIVVRHRSNLGRLFRGEEPRFQFGRKRAATDDSSPPAA
jgi:glycerol-3-phosphate acyltransferase PlsY